MSKNRNSHGFTLIELVVATFLSSIVLMGMFSLMSSMISAEVNGMRSGTVTAWALAGINSMNYDIETAGAVAYPPAGTGQNSLVVCANWSEISGTNLALLVSSTYVTRVYSYCWDNTDVAPSPYANAILRSVTLNVPCPSTPPPACTAANYGPDSVVATGVYQDAARDPVFFVDPNPANPNLNQRSVHVRLSVGNPAAGVSMGGNEQTVMPIPVSVPFDTEITLEE